MTEKTSPRSDDDEVVARITLAPRPHKSVYWLAVVLALVAFAIVQAQQYALTQQVKHANCRTTLFLRDTDHYIVEHSLHPDDPKIAQFRAFLAQEENRSC